MGKLLGSHDTDDLNRPDLNKCPECGSYFAPDADNCPICGAYCPEDCRAGTRPAPKHKKQSFSRASSRVVFVEWYHSFWFIALAMLFMPIVGIILLITSPHKTKSKVLFAAAALLYTVFVSWGVGGILLHVITQGSDTPDRPTVSIEEYAPSCTAVDAVTYYRTPNAYLDQRITLTLKVTERITDSESQQLGEDGYIWYLCTDSESRISLLVRDLTENTVNLLPGDTVCIYGIGVGERTVYDAAYTAHTAPAIQAFYLTLKETDTE